MYCTRGIPKQNGETQLLLYYIIVKFKNKKTNPLCPVKPSQLPLPPPPNTHTQIQHIFFHQES